MKNFWKWAALLSCWALAQAAFAQSVLWQGTAIGMTPAEVKALFPGSVEHTASAKASLDSGAQKLLSAPSVAILDREFEAAFYFQKGLLEQVSLTLVRPGSRSVEAKTYESLVDALKTKYGPEISRSRVTTRTSARGQSVWNSSGTAVEAYFFSLDDDHARVTVRYHTRTAEAASKL